MLTGLPDEGGGCFRETLRGIPLPTRQALAPPGRGTPPAPYPPFVPDGGFAISGLRGVSPYTVTARQAQRRRAGLRRHTCLCAGWRHKCLIRPTASSRKPLYRRPGKRSAARRWRPDQARRCFYAGRLTPCPAYGSCDLPLIYSPLLLKLPVLTASKSLRRSRKAGAARMDAG